VTALGLVLAGPFPGLFPCCAAFTGDLIVDDCSADGACPLPFGLPAFFTGAFAGMLAGTLGPTLSDCLAGSAAFLFRRRRRFFFGASPLSPVIEVDGGPAAAISAATLVAEVD